MSERMFTTMFTALYLEILSLSTHFYVSNRNDTEYTHARTHMFCQGIFLICNRITSTKFQSFCMTNLQHDSHKLYDTPNLVI